MKALCGRYAASSTITTGRRIRSTFTSEVVGLPSLVDFQFGGLGGLRPSKCRAELRLAHKPASGRILDAKTLDGRHDHNGAAIVKCAAFAKRAGHIQHFHETATAVSAPGGKDAWDRPGL